MEKFGNYFLNLQLWCLFTLCPPPFLLLFQERKYSGGCIIREAQGKTSLIVLENVKNPKLTNQIMFNIISEIRMKSRYSGMYILFCALSLFAQHKGLALEVLSQPRCGCFLLHWASFTQEKRVSLQGKKAQTT